MGWTANGRWEGKWGDPNPDALEWGKNKTPNGGGLVDHQALTLLFGISEESSKAPIKGGIGKEIKELLAELERPWVLLPQLPHGIEEEHPSRGTVLLKGEGVIGQPLAIKEAAETVNGTSSFGNPELNQAGDGSV